jgi:glycosyltransferase involved in cell wall biosynthesis
VGGLIESKRLNLLIEAFARAFNGNPDVSLVIFGEGPERRRLERMIRDLGQEDRITLMGAQPRSVIAKKMQSCRCFVLPSHHETFGVVYIEAMASGLPIIATRCGGPEHFIHEENGLLIPVDDVQALIGAMRYMYLNFSRYDSNRISGEAKKLFSPESVGKQLMEIYKELIS